MRRCGAEKLSCLVIEVEVDAERAGCFAERQVRLGLVVGEAIPETRDWLGSPVRRTRTSGRMRVRRTSNQIKARLFCSTNAGPGAGPDARRRFQAAICGVLTCTEAHGGVRILYRILHPRLVCGGGFFLTTRQIRRRWERPSLSVVRRRRAAAAGFAAGEPAAAAAPPPWPRWRECRGERTRRHGA